MDVEAVDLDEHVIETVQLPFDRAPVEPVAPVRHHVLEHGEVDTELGLVQRETQRPVSSEAALEILERRVGHLDTERTHGSDS